MGLLECCLNWWKPYHEKKLLSFECWQTVYKLQLSCYFPCFPCLSYFSVCQKQYLQAYLHDTELIIAEFLSKIGAYICSWNTGLHMEFFQHLLYQRRDMETRQESQCECQTIIWGHVRYRTEQLVCLQGVQLNRDMAEWEYHSICWLHARTVTKTSYL